MTDEEISAVSVSAALGAVAGIAGVALLQRLTKRRFAYGKLNSQIKIHGGSTLGQHNESAAASPLCLEIHAGIAGVSNTGLAVYLVTDIDVSKIDYINNKTSYPTPWVMELRVEQGHGLILTAGLVSGVGFITIAPSDLINDRLSPGSGSSQCSVAYDRADGKNNRTLNAAYVNGNQIHGPGDFIIG